MNEGHLDLKVVLVGPPDSGKSSMILSLTSDAYKNISSEKVQAKKKELTQCMRKHLKPSDEVQTALRDVNNSLKKKQTKMIFIWVSVFFQSLHLPVAMLLLDALPDMMLVESYRQDW